ncbi:unnamed protein product [Arctia plantaginis]|uniref:THAP-type domain-containing protein n=1 Tax=Arctia plantaginis TaxID=874455 RepID=A0A8S0ZGD5_ARCPL|nr:unnamed protein product [Arctia plantaginis]
MSITKCCVPGCPNSSGSEEILHKFPNPERERELFNTWLYAIGGDIVQLENNHIFKYRRVCHLHFEEKYWCRNNRLSKIAVPTKNMPGLSFVKFSYGTKALKSIQTSEALTSKDLTLEKISSEATDLRTMETSEASTSKVGQHMQNFALPKKRVKRVAVTPGEHALYKRLVKVGVKLSKCRSKVKIQASKIKALQNITTNPKFLEILDALPSTSKILTLLQFREIKKGDRGRRFTLQEKLVSLSIMKQSSKGYRFLRKIFILPSRQILLQLLHQANIKPGINSNTIEQLKKATEAMKLEDKLCILLFDEMSLKPNVAYNERKDRVCGFVTNGDEVYSEYADHAQVFMIRGLLKNYKQPVAYTFSQAATKGPELAKQLKAVVTALQGAGLTVVATVCDQGTNNVSCIKYLLQETRGILLRRGEEPKHNLILVNNQEIIPLYDPPHLIKCVRNNLISKHLKYVKDGETKVAKWAHIMLLHKENPGYKGIRLVPKLTDAHCDPNKIPKMKVKFATQLFSQTVASNMGYLADKGILPADAKDTADILLFFDQLFDAMNGSHGKKKKYGKPLLGPATPTSIHMKVWRESKNMLQKMKFLNRSTLRDEYVPTLNNWAGVVKSKLIASLILFPI